MDTSFYLIRHGIKEKAIGDVPISSKGLVQAQATGRHLRLARAKAVYTSPLRRAKETAAIIAAEQGLTIIEDIRLRERANWGDLPGQTFSEFVAMWERCTRDREYVPPVGDSARQSGHRLASLLLELSAKHPQNEIIVVTHGGLITDFLLNMFAEEQLNNWHSDFIAAQTELVPECSITKLSYDGAAFYMEYFASVTHLTHNAQ